MPAPPLRQAFQLERPVGRPSPAARPTPRRRQSGTQEMHESSARHSDRPTTWPVREKSSPHLLGESLAPGRRAARSPAGTRTAAQGEIAEGRATERGALPGAKRRVGGWLPDASLRWRQAGRISAPGRHRTRLANPQMARTVSQCGRSSRCPARRQTMLHRNTGRACCPTRTTGAAESALQQVPARVRPAQSAT